MSQPFLLLKEVYGGGILKTNQPFLLLKKVYEVSS